MNYKLYKTDPNLSEPNAVMTVGVEPCVSFLLNVNNPEEEKYLAWLEEGNEPLPPDPLPEPEPLTAQQKLQAAGLTIEELKGLLGL